MTEAQSEVVMFTTEAQFEALKFMVDSGLVVSQLSEDQLHAVIDGAMTYALAAIHDSSIQSGLFEAFSE